MGYPPNGWIPNLGDEHTQHTIKDRLMELILDGKSELGAHVWRLLFDLSKAFD